MALKIYPGGVGGKGRSITIHYNAELDRAAINIPDDPESADAWTPVVFNLNPMTVALGNQVAEIRDQDLSDKELTLKVTQLSVNSIDGLENAENSEPMTELTKDVFLGLPMNLLAKFSDQLAKMMGVSEGEEDFTERPSGTA